MSTPGFLLIGIGGGYNYGCEAIVRGTVQLLRSRWPHCRIRYASLRPDDDRRRLSGTDVEVVSRRRYGRYSPRNITRKLLQLFGVEWIPNMERLEMLDGIDAVLSIGGDLYTLSPSGSYPRALMRFAETVEQRGVPCVLWGASVGPFTANPAVEREFREHLQKLSLIVAREPQTLDYLERLGIGSHVTFAADPAFAVAPEIKRQSHGRGRPTVAINLSPLSTRHAGSDVDQAIASQAAGITRLMQRWACDSVLVPHVVCDFNEHDDDLRYLRRVYAALPAAERRRVELVQTDGGFLAVKRALAQTDLVIAARMHCAINALAAEVPTLFLSYSQKAIGMSQLVYGSVEYALPLADFGGPRMLTAAMNLFDKSDAVMEKLRGRISLLRGQTTAAVDAIAALIGQTREQTRPRAAA